MNAPDFDAAATFVAANARVLDRRRFQRLFEGGAAVEMALRIMDEANAWDGALVLGACDWLGSVAPAEGGAAFVGPDVAAWPHAPWWVPEAGHPASLFPTGMIAGMLHARQVSHPWLDHATQVMWTRIGTLTQPSGYDMFGVLKFLQHVPDRDRAQLDDGGWTFNWPAWSPAAERDWRGFLTVDALRVLRANGR